MFWYPEMSEPGSGNVVMKRSVSDCDVLLSIKLTKAGLCGAGGAGLDVRWMQHDRCAACAIGRCHGWASYKSIVLQCVRTPFSPFT